MPVDIFPYIDIPVVSVVWNYTGLSPEEMEKRIVTIFERAHDHHRQRHRAHRIAVLQRRLGDPRLLPAERARSKWRWRRSPRISQTLLRILPPGIFPPSIMKYDASSVPILQLGLESKTLSEQELFDLGQNFIRTQLATIQGAAVPLPYGGKFRQVMVDLESRTRCTPSSSRRPTFRTRWTSRT